MRRIPTLKPITSRCLAPYPFTEHASEQPVSVWEPKDVEAHLGRVIAERDRLRAAVENLRAALDRVVSSWDTCGEGIYRGGVAKQARAALAETKG
jgi:hypothetical protein